MGTALVLFSYSTKVPHPLWPRGPRPRTHATPSATWRGYIHRHPSPSDPTALGTEDEGTGECVCPADTWALNVECGPGQKTSLLTVASHRADVRVPRASDPHPRLIKPGGGVGGHLARGKDSRVPEPASAEPEPGAREAPGSDPPPPATAGPGEGPEEPLWREGLPGGVSSSSSGPVWVGPQARAQADDNSHRPQPNARAENISKNHSRPSPAQCTGGLGLNSGQFLGDQEREFGGHRWDKELNPRNPSSLAARPLPRVPGGQRTNAQTQERLPRAQEHTRPFQTPRWGWT